MVNSISSSTYYFHHQTNDWIEGPKLNVARHSHGSGIVIDTVTNEKYVVVIGGYGIDRSLNSMEFLSHNKWTYGKA